MEEIQKEIDSRLDTLLTEDQKKQLQTMRQRPAGGGPGRGGPPPGGRPIFRALRYATGFPGFAGKGLMPGKTLEEMQPKDSEKKEAEKKGCRHDSGRHRIRKRGIMAEEVPMIQTVEAVIDATGCVRLLGAVRVDSTRRARALVTVLEEPAAVPDEAALLAQTALAADWSRPEENAAWSYLQPDK